AVDILAGKLHHLSLDACIFEFAEDVIDQNSGIAVFSRASIESDNFHLSLPALDLVSTKNRTSDALRLAHDPEPQIVFHAVGQAASTNGAPDRTGRTTPAPASNHA